MPFDISAESKMEQMSMQPTPAQNQPSKFSDLRQDDENDIENSMLNPPDTVKVKKTNNVKINFDSDEKEAINRIHDGGDENYWVIRISDHKEIYFNLNSTMHDYIFIISKW